MIVYLSNLSASFLICFITSLTWIVRPCWTKLRWKTEALQLCHFPIVKVIIFLTICSCHDFGLLNRNIFFYQSSLIIVRTQALFTIFASHGSTYPLPPPPNTLRFKWYLFYWLIFIDLTYFLCLDRIHLLEREVTNLRLVSGTQEHKSIVSGSLDKDYNVTHLCSVSFTFKYMKWTMLNWN